MNRFANGHLIKVPACFTKGVFGYLIDERFIPPWNLVTPLIDESRLISRIIFYAIQSEASYMLFHYVIIFYTAVPNYSLSHREK